MILALVVLSLQQPPKSADIIKSVIAKYHDLKILECSYKTTAPKSKSLIYSGTISYKAKHHMRFSISDPAQGCTAGEDLNAKGQGSTWVTPADQRGYNDTLMDRQPYLLVRFIRDETKGNISTIWLENVETIKVGKKNFWRIRAADDSDLSLTIDSATYLITEFASSESFHTNSRLTSYVHYGK